jgi:AraC-like DNA-binding protein
MGWLDRCNPQIHAAGAVRLRWSWHDPLRSLADHELLLFGAGLRGSIAWDGGSVAITGGDWVLVPPGLPHICRGAGTGRQAPWLGWVHFDWEYTDGGDPQPLLRYASAPAGGPPLGIRPTPAWAPVQGLVHGRMAGMPALADLHARIALGWRQGAVRRAATRALLVELLGLILEPPMATDEHPQALAWTVRAALDALAERPFRDDEPLPALLARLGRSPDHAARAFRRAFGLPPARYLMGLRLRRAEELLTSGLRPAEVAHRLGFADAGYFNRVFRRFTGLAPGRWSASTRSS